MNTAIKSQNNPVQETVTDRMDNQLVFDYLIKPELPFKKRLQLSGILIIIAIFIVFLSPNLVSGKFLFSFELRSPNWIYLIIGWITFTSAFLLLRKSLVFHEKESVWEDLKRKSSDWVPLDSQVFKKHIEDYQFWKGVKISFTIQTVVVLIIALAILVLFTFAEQLGLRKGIIDFLGAKLTAEYGNFAYFISIFPMLSYGGTMYIVILLLVLGLPPLIPGKVSNNLISKSVIDKFKLFETLIADISKEGFEEDLDIVWEVKQKPGTKFVIPNDLKVTIKLLNKSELCMGIQSQLTYNVGKPYLYYVILVKSKYKNKSIKNKVKRFKLHKSSGVGNTVIKVEKSDKVVVPVVIRKTTSKTVYSTSNSDNLRLFNVCLTWLNQFEQVLLD